MVPFKSGTRRLSAACLRIETPEGKRRTLVHLEDYLIGSSMAAPKFSVTAPAVFVGYGVTERRSGYDDYAGVDARGKVVIVFRGGPDALSSEIRAHASSTRETLRNAAAHGAVALITIPTNASERNTPWRRVVAHPGDSAMTWVAPDGAAHVTAPEIKATARMSAAGAAKIFSGAGYSYESLRAIEANEPGALRAFELPVHVTLAGAMRFETLESPNVVAFLEGADPALKEEVVVLSAHLDHEGVKTPAKRGGDAIFNGALDNAMGVAALIEAAERFAAGPAPKRSILFVATTGEEQGLLGSDYFARFPPADAGKIVADINLDMPLVLYPFTDVIAFGVERSSLGAVVTREAGAMGVAVTPDPMPELNLFTRSDHYRFVEQGVPSLFLMTGFKNGGEKVFDDFMRDHYHRPSDDLSLPIDYEAAARFAELNYRIARAVADSDSAPQWTEGDYFGELFAGSR